LRAGGNAMDAAIAASAVLGVVEPAMSGVGGDCVVLYAPKGGSEVQGYIGLGTAPAAATRDWYEERGLDRAPPGSPHMVAIPGLVEAWARLLADHGTKGLDELLRPAIALAEGGYAVGERVAWDWARFASELARDVNTARAFLPDGRPPRAGARHRRPELARTLKRVAEHGADGFYRGPIAADIVRYLRGLGGLHGEDDLARYRGA